MATIIDGKLIGAKVREGIRKEVDSIPENLRKPCLAVIIVGSDPASQIYVRNKKKACEEVGFVSIEYALDENAGEEALLELVEKLNRDNSVDGILVQLPLPKGYDDKKIIEHISHSKDVDAFSFENVGKITVGEYDFLPCTPAGVMELLHEYKIDVCGKNAVVIGRSNIVGKPQALLLLHENATVTIAHSKTQNLKEHCLSADIIVAAVGKAKFITADMVKDGAVVIDVGMNRDTNGKLCGDVDFENVKEKASFITPVPGGVGPMTITELMKNTLTAYKKHMDEEN